MKTRKTLALFAFALLTLGVTAQQAKAQTTCSTIPATVNGSLTINQTGDCNITHAVTVNGGDLTITATGNISTQAVSVPNGGLSLSSTGTTTLSGAISVGVNMLLHATGNFKATSTLTATTGGIEIASNTSGGNTLFTIGSSTSNGVTTSITANNGVFITNGNSASTGGITITNGSKINVAGTNNPGLILLNAQNGNLTVTAGTLSASGSTGQHGNSIFLQANTLKTGTGSSVIKITANSASGAPNNSQAVGIAAQTINIPGTGGLTIQANGAGGAQVALNPQNYYSITSNGNLDLLSWTVTTTGTLNAPLSVTGVGQLTVTSNGANDRVGINGYPITFSNGALTVQSMADATTQIFIGYILAYNGNPGAVFNNTGAVLVDASGVGSGKGGGNIQITCDNLSVTAPSFTVQSNGVGAGASGTIALSPNNSTFAASTSTVAITTTGVGSTNQSSPNIRYSPAGNITVNSPSFLVTANGPTSADGNAGIISFSTNTLTLAATNTVASIAANGPASPRNGAGGSITLNPGFGTGVKLGNNAGDLSLSATAGGGTSTSLNNGGSITVTNSPNLTLDTAQATALNVSVPAGTGNGGTINITASTITFSGSGYALNANAGATSGSGGNISLATTNSVIIGAVPGGLQASASGSGSQRGGMIAINRATGPSPNTPIDLVGSFNVSAGQSALPSTFDGSVALNLDTNNNPIVCQAYKNTTTTWPASYWYCGSNQNNSSIVLSQLQQLSPPTITAMTAINTWVAVFYTIANANAFLADNETAEVNTQVNPIAGWYLQSANRITVLEAVTQGDVVLVLPAKTVQETARHETGHVLDMQWGLIVGRAFVSQPGGNQQQSYSQFLAHDFRNLTYQAPGYTQLLPACGTGAIFEGQIDPRTGNQICPLQGDLVGLNNQQILQTIDAYFFTQNQSLLWAETWAQGLAVYSGNSTGGSEDYFLQNYFPCSQIYVLSLYVNGVVAPLSSYPSTCTN